MVRRYGESVKIVHFIGVSKPWHAGFDSETGTYVPNEPHDAHASKHLQFWWQIYHSDVVKDMKAVNKVITNVPAHLANSYVVFSPFNYVVQAQ